MAVIRCPSCGKPNPDFLDTCQYCDTSLRGPATPPPQGAAPEPAEPPAPAGGEAEGDIFAKLRSTPAFSEEEAEAQPAAELPDWLGRLSGADEAAQAEPAKPAEDQASRVSSWLESLQSKEPEEQADTRDWYWTGAQGPAETPAPQAAAPSSAAELPDWLRSLDSETPPQAAPPAEDETSGVPDWLQGITAGTTAQPLPAAPGPAEEMPDWLQESSTAPVAPPQPAAPTAAPSPAAAAPGEELPDWLKDFETIAPSPAAPAQPIAASLPEAQPAEELPDWLQGAGMPAAKQPEAAPRAAEPPMAAEPPVVAAPAAGDELPDWLRTMAGAAPAEEEAPALGEAPDWRQSFEAAVPEQPPVAPLAASVPPEAGPAPQEELPEWLRALGTGPMPAGTPLSGAQAAPAAEAQAGPSMTTPEPAPEEQPDWLRELGIPAALPEAAAPSVAAVSEEQPEWLSALGVTPLPQGEPSSLPPAEPIAGAVAPVGPGETTLPATTPDQLPDWLANLAPAAPPAPPVTSQPAVVSGVHLAAATLPSWLEAMRPTELQRPTIAPEVDDYEETVGVLAGLRGVLRPQTEAIQPGKSATKVHKLEVTEAQSKQAGLLARTLAEASEAHPAPKRSFWQTLPIARLAVFAALFLASALPMSLPAAKGYFAPPQRWNPAAQAAFDLVDSLSPAQPALVAFDYDPAQAGELDPLAQAIIAHLQRRGVPIVGISTSPAGAATGEALLNQVFEPAAYGLQYLNLGYLPGGPVGMLQMTNDLQPLFTVDYRGNAAVWEAAILKQTRQLSDFGVIVLVSATPDTVRAWLEQLQSYSARPAVIAAVSAGAEPLVRPYYDADPAKAQLKGLVSGILGAAQYERQSGVAGMASGTMWDTLGWGLLVVIVLLIGGNLFYGLAGLLRRQKR